MVTSDVTAPSGSSTCAARRAVAEKKHLELHDSPFAAGGNSGYGMGEPQERHPACTIERFHPGNRSWCAQADRGLGCASGARRVFWKPGLPGAVVCRNRRDLQGARIAHPERATKARATESRFIDFGMWDLSPDGRANPEQTRNPRRRCGRGQHATTALQDPAARGMTTPHP